MVGTEREGRNEQRDLGEISIDTCPFNLGFALPCRSGGEGCLRGCSLLVLLPFLRRAVSPRTGPKWKGRWEQGRKGREEQCAACTPVQGRQRWAILVGSRTSRDASASSYWQMERGTHAKKSNSTVRPPSSDVRCAHRRPAAGPGVIVSAATAAARPCTPVPVPAPPNPCARSRGTVGFRARGRAPPR